jgi:ribosomal protein L13E
LSSKVNKKAPKAKTSAKSEERKIKRKKVPEITVGENIKSFVVYSKHGRRLMREGKGFSLLELMQAGLTVNQAKAAKIRIDMRRKTVHEQNVKMLKEALSK